MPSDSLRWITMILDSLPRGPVRRFANSRIYVYMADGSLSREAAYRQAVADAGGHPQHGPVVRAVIERAVTDAPVTDALALLPPPQSTLCGQCREPIVDACRWNDVDYCSSKCSHDAGDRNRCRPGKCGCTAFAIKRRQLRKHRQQMRVMQQMIWDNELAGDLRDVMKDELGSPDYYELDVDSEMDAGSDCEDPMMTQANEISAVSDIVQLSRNMVELAALRRNQKRARDSD